MDIRKYINERLDAGENMESILNDIADVANKMSEEMAHDSVKVSRAQEVVDIVGAFLSDFYPDATFTVKGTEFTGEDLVEVMDELVHEIAPVLKSTRELMEAIEALDGISKEKPKAKKVTVKVPSDVDPDVVIKDFLRGLGI